MKTVAVVQARMGSTRLPGKVLVELNGKPVLWHVVSRLKAAGNIDDIVIATTQSDIDVEIVNFCVHEGLNVFRGSETDVLSRYYHAARMVQADSVVRITADCPLLDPWVTDEMVGIFKNDLLQGKGIDYLSNVIQRTFPRGLDTEIFSLAALEKAFKEANKEFEREHVTPYFYQNPELFKCHAYLGKKDFSQYRLTLDTNEDLLLIEKIFDFFPDSETIFPLEKIIEILENNPELAEINANVEHKKLDGKS